jgi:surface polysaccharide O-acyltransferase-like enzyme
LLLLVLAHVKPPGWLFELRNFDVPLMALVSGLAYRFSRPEGSWGGFILKRFKRLVLPTWIFLTFYFLFLATVSRGVFPFSREQVQGAYLLGSDVEYVWIIRVFVFIAVTAPFWRWLDRKTAGPAGYLCVIVLLVGFADAVIVSMRWLDGPEWLSVPLAIAAANFGFCALFGLGYRLPVETQKRIGAVACGFGAVFLAFLVLTWLRQGHYVSTQNYKYPPRAYYLGYGAALSLGLWLAATRFRAVLEKRWLLRVIGFLSENSLWLYLWHILFLHVVGSRVTYWAAQYVLVLAGAALVVAVQRRVMEAWIPRAGRWGGDLKVIFTG